MPIMPDTALFAAGAHDPAYRAAADGALCLGAPGRGEVRAAVHARRPSSFVPTNAARNQRGAPSWERLTHRTVSLRLILAALCISAYASTAASPQGGTPPNMQPAPEGSKNGADQK
jgi:hypothetical protein